MNFSKIISLFLAALIVTSAMVSCAVAPPSATAVTASAETDSYVSFLRERLGDSMPETIAIAYGDDTVKYGADLSSFVDEEGYVIRATGGDLVILGKTEASIDRAVRHFANYGNSDSYSFTYGEGYRVGSITIANNPISEYSIMLPEINDSCHDFAAECLQTYIGKACGFYLPIVPYSAEASGRFIRLQRAFPEDSAYAILGDEGFNIFVDGTGDLIIRGGQYRGCMYGVADLLEEHIGWRFIYDPASYGNGAVTEYDYLFEAEHIDIPAGLRYTESPDIAVRHNIFRGHVYLSENFRAKRKINSNLSPAKNLYGLIGFANHGLQSAMADRLFFEDFEYDVSVQPCYTDEHLIEVCKDYFTMKTQARVDAGQVPGRDFINVDVAQFDTATFCMCESCMELYVLDGGNVGPVLNFTNEMARHLREQFGDEIQVSMLSYWGTTSVPEVTRPEPNVNISFCFFVDIKAINCYSHSINGKECDPENYTSNSSYAERLTGWSKIAENLTVWYYPGYWRLTCLPAPFIRVLHEDIKFLKECGVDGIYVCVSGYKMADEKIIPYLLSNLTWDCDISDEEYMLMVEEYYRIIYGEGYTYLLEYEEHLNRYAKDGCWSTNNGSNPVSRMDFAAINDGFLGDVELFELAISKAATAEQVKHIEELCLSVYFTGLVATYTDLFENGDADSRQIYEQIWDVFMDRAVRHGYYMTVDSSYNATEHLFYFRDIAADLAEPIDMSLYFEIDYNSFRE